MILVGILILLIGASLLCSVRAVLGPTAPDRVVAFDALTSLMVTVLVILGVLYEASFFLDVALVYAMLAFLGTLAIAKYLEGRRVGD